MEGHSQPVKPPVARKMVTCPQCKGRKVELRADGQLHRIDCATCKGRRVVIQNG
jgi:Zn finger protein HypA/HybF involved in hydrogenase expression